MRRIGLKRKCISDNTELYTLNELAKFVFNIICFGGKNKYFVGITDDFQIGFIRKEEFDVAISTSIAEKCLLFYHLRGIYAYVDYQHNNENSFILDIVDFAYNDKGDSNHKEEYKEIMKAI